MRRLPARPTLPSNSSARFLTNLRDMPLISNESAMLSNAERSSRRRKSWNTIPMWRRISGRCSVRVATEWNPPDTHRALVRLAIEVRQAQHGCLPATCRADENAERSAPHTHGYILNDRPLAAQERHVLQVNHRGFGARGSVVGCRHGR